MSKAKYKFLHDIATGDVAFEAYGPTLSKLFSNSALAVCAASVELKTVKGKIKCSVKATAEKIEDLLFDFIGEIVYLKDAETLLFPEVKAQVAETSTGYKLKANLLGEIIDPSKHELKEDIKSATYHKLTVERERSGWKATVILDI